MITAGAWGPGNTTVKTPMSAEQWMEPEFAVPGTEYEMIAQGTSQWGVGVGAGQRATLRLGVDFNAAEVSAFNIGAAVFGNETTHWSLFFTVRLTVLVLTASTAAVHWDGTLDRDVGGGNKQRSEHMSFVQHAEPVGVNFAQRNLVRLTGTWDALTGAGNHITTRTTRTTRRVSAG